MYSPGNIIYFDPFYFSDGSLPKPKYFISLKEGENNNVLASLATKLDCVPVTMHKKHGCLDNPTINFNCYCFEKDRIVTEASWGFPKETYIYGYRLALFDLTDLKSKYKIETVDYQRKGKLIEKEYNAIISCLKNSPAVKRKYRRMLGSNI
jgi:hypothetical protein